MARKRTASKVNCSVSGDFTSFLRQTFSRVVQTFSPEYARKQWRGKNFFVESRRRHSIAQHCTQKSMRVEEPDVEGQLKRKWVNKFKNLDKLGVLTRSLRVGHYGVYCSRKVLVTPSDPVSKCEEALYREYRVTLSHRTCQKIHHFPAQQILRKNARYKDRERLYCMCLFDVAITRYTNICNAGLEQQCQEWLLKCTIENLDTR